jgi:hypothetical protein
MVTISISVEAFRAIAGVPPDNSLRDDRGGYRFHVDRETLDQLSALRGPSESYSAVILRVAKGHGCEQ